MPPRQKVPTYRLHKSSGQARVILAGRHIYLGRYGSPESREAYARLLAETFRPGTQPFDAAAPVGSCSDLTMNELMVRYLGFAEHYYVKDGKPTKELTCMKEALGHLRGLYGSLLASEFGPLKLKAVREQMIGAGLARGVINNRVNRIKRFVKWAVSEELVPAGFYQALQSVSGLRFGRSEARETEPVRPVPDAWVDATLPCLSPQVAAMVQLQRLTGMRPGEVTRMRPCDIDVTEEVWVYRPADHKNRWRGHERVVPMGPQAKAILKSFWNRCTDAFLFSPREAEDWRNRRQRSEAAENQLDAHGVFARKSKPPQEMRIRRQK